MWTIENLDLSAVPSAQAFMSDGNAVVDVPRGGVGTSDRLMITPLGSVDITDMWALGGGPRPLLILVGDQPYWYDGAAAMTIALAGDGTLRVSGDGNDFSAYLQPFPEVDAADLDMVAQMVAQGIVPYSDPPPQTRPYSAVEPVAQGYFAYSANAALLGLTVYDWTTADFFRMDIFNWYRYTALPGVQLSGADIVRAIWTASWPPYQPTNPAFMASMLMRPCSTEEEVLVQYGQVAGTLTPMLDALKRVTAAAAQSMPRTCILAKPALYSGQVDVSNLGETAFATYFLEYPGNSGPPPQPMGMPLAEALAGFMAAGSTVTLKSFLSTTDSQEDALRYSNGILLEVAPHPASAVWTQCAYVTPLSNEATKTEYLFGPGAAFTVGQARQETVNGRTIIVIPLTSTV